ncbi:MAG: hypothetical protein AABX10_04355 [Nanoarchaeota archaeon]
MRSFTKEQIETARMTFEEMDFEERKANVGGMEFRYFVLPQNLQPGLPYFVARMTGRPEDGSLFGVSDKVPVELRDYPVFHEVMEFAGNQEPGKCLKTLKRELEIVPQHSLNDYIGYRKRFFRGLIKFIHGEKEREHYTLRDMHEFQGSLDYLKSLRQ